MPLPALRPGIEAYEAQQEKWRKSNGKAMESMFFFFFFFFFFPKDIWCLLFKIFGCFWLLCLIPGVF